MFEAVACGHAAVAAGIAVVRCIENAFNTPGLLAQCVWCSCSCDACVTANPRDADLYCAASKRVQQAVWSRSRPQRSDVVIRAPISGAALHTSARRRRVSLRYSIIVSTRNRLEHRNTRTAPPPVLGLRASGPDRASWRRTLQGSASAKTRAEVSGGGRKPLQQKGSGQARKGSTRTPLTKGGGVVFGPKPKDWSISMNKKERRLAVGTALQSAAPDTVVVDTFASIGEALKTKAVVNLCKNVGVDVNETWTLIVTDGKNEAVERCAKNLKHVAVNSSETLHFYDVLRADKIVVENGALALLHERYT